MIGSPAKLDENQPPDCLKTSVSTPGHDAATRQLS